MLWGALMLQERGAPGSCLVWFRLQYVCAMLATAALLHLILLMTASGKARLVVPWIYAGGALLALLCVHPLVLHAASAGTLPKDLDTASAGPLFGLYALLPIVGMAVAGILALRTQRRLGPAALSEWEAEDYAPLGGDLRWIIVGIGLVLAASVVELLDFLDVLDVSLSPRAVAQTLFCVLTASLLGRAVARAERRKRRFSALAQARLADAVGVAHDVGNGLLAVRKLSEGARRRLPPSEETGPARAALDRSAAEVNRLERTLRRMQNTARLGAGGEIDLGDPQWTDLRRLLTELCDGRAALLALEAQARAEREGRPPGEAAPRHRVTLDLGPLPALAPLYPDELGQALVNLLDNAVKYTPDGGDIRVRAWADGGAIHISVTDPGVGMTPGQQAHIFDLFYRAEAPSRAITGLGIGLHLVRRLVEAQGGRIAVSSAPGRGSTFSLAFPMEGSFQDSRQATENPVFPPTAERSYNENT